MAIWSRRYFGNIRHSAQRQPGSARDAGLAREAAMTPAAGVGYDAYIMRRFVVISSRSGT